MALRQRLLTCALLATALLTGCRTGMPVIDLDHPHLTPQVRVLDLTVHSTALGKEMPLRVVVPSDQTLSRQQLPVVYFLHGAGTNLHDWTNHSDIASFAAQGFVLVFVDAPGSFYIDDLRNPKNRYEPYITEEVPETLHAAVRMAARDKQHTAIVGISRGGYGAVVLGLKHPNLYSFIGTLSGALDLNERHVTWRSPLRSQDIQRAFGPNGSPTRRNNDPFDLVTRLYPNHSPYFFVACGTGDSLYSINQRFVYQLARQYLPAESHLIPGSHNWQFWSAQLPALEAALQTRLTETPAPKPLTTARLQ